MKVFLIIGLILVGLMTTQIYATDSITARTNSDDLDVHSSVSVFSSNLSNPNTERWTVTGQNILTTKSYHNNQITTINNQANTINSQNSVIAGNLVTISNQANTISYQNGVIASQSDLINDQEERINSLVGSDPSWGTPNSMTMRMDTLGKYIDVLGAQDLYAQDFGTSMKITGKFLAQFTPVFYKGFQIGIIDVGRETLPGGYIYQADNWVEIPTDLQDGAQVVVDEQEKEIRGHIYKYTTIRTYIGPK